MHNIISDLQQLIRQPSVSARHEGLEECAHLVCDIMSRAGITAEVLYLRKPHLSQTNLKSNKDGNACDSVNSPINDNKTYYREIERSEERRVGKECRSM